MGRSRYKVEKINVSSCKFVVTLHGSAPDPEVREDLENAVRETPGVRDVVNKLRVMQDSGASVFPRAGFGVSGRI